MPGREQELDFLGAGSSLTEPSTSSPAVAVPAKNPLNPNSNPDFPTPDATAEGFPGGESLAVNFQPLDGAGLAGSVLDPRNHGAQPGLDFEFWDFGSHHLAGLAGDVLDPRNHGAQPGLDFKFWDFGILGVIPHPEPVGEAVPGISVMHTGLCWPAARELPGPRQTGGRGDSNYWLH